MALVQLGENIHIVTLKDGIQNLVINDSLVLPKAYEEDINELKSMIPADKQFGGLAIQVVKITLSNEIKYHPALVAIDQAEQPITKSGNWVILVCPPGDRDKSRICLKYENVDQLMPVFNRKSNPNSND